MLMIDPQALATLLKDLRPEFGEIGTRDIDVAMRQERIDFVLSLIEGNAPAINPWHPMTDPVDLKHMGKLIEESGEVISATARCVIQGIDETHPITGKVNRDWLEDEIADFGANVELVIKRFGLDREKMAARCGKKIEMLQEWHAMA